MLLVTCVELELIRMENRCVESAADASNDGVSSISMQWEMKALVVAYRVSIRVGATNGHYSPMHLTDYLQVRHASSP